MATPPTIALASLGMADTLILMVMALVVFGPRRLPQIGRQMGKLMYEFRKAANDFKFQMEEELRAAEEAEKKSPQPPPAPALEASTTAAETKPLPAPADSGAPATPAADPYAEAQVYPPPVPGYETPAAHVPAPTAMAGSTPDEPLSPSTPEAPTSEASHG